MGKVLKISFMLYLIAAGIAAIFLGAAVISSPDTPFIAKVAALFGPTCGFSCFIAAKLVLDT